MKSTELKRNPDGTIIPLSLNDFTFVDRKKIGDSHGCVLKDKNGNYSLIKQDKYQTALAESILMSETLSTSIFRVILGIGFTPENQLIYVEQIGDQEHHKGLFAAKFALFSPYILKTSNLYQLNGKKTIQQHDLDRHRITGLELCLAASIFMEDIDARPENILILTADNNQRIASRIDFEHSFEPFILSETGQEIKRVTKGVVDFLNHAHFRQCYAKNIFLTEEFAAACDEVGNISMQPIFFAIDGIIDDLKTIIEKDLPSSNNYYKQIWSGLLEIIRDRIPFGYNADLGHKYTKIHLEIPNLIKDSLYNKLEARREEMRGLASIIRIQIAIINYKQDDFRDLLLANPQFLNESKHIWFDISTKTSDEPVKHTVRELIDHYSHILSKKQRHDLILTLESVTALNQGELVTEAFTETKKLEPESLSTSLQIILNHHTDRISVLHNSKSHLMTHDIRAEFCKYFRQDIIHLYRGQIESECHKTLTKAVFVHDKYNSLINLKFNHNELSLEEIDHVLAKYFSKEEAEEYKSRHQEISVESINECRDAEIDKVIQQSIGNFMGISMHMMEAQKHPENHQPLWKTRISLERDRVSNVYR